MVKYHCDRVSCDRVISEDEEQNKSVIVCEGGQTEEVALCQACLKELAVFLHDSASTCPYR